MLLPAVTAGPDGLSGGQSWRLCSEVWPSAYPLSSRTRLSSFLDLFSLSVTVMGILVLYHTCFETIEGQMLLSAGERAAVPVA